MKLEKLSALAELVAAIAIVVTLVYLSIQVRQNTDALNAQSRQSIMTSAQTELLTSVDHPEVIVAISKTEPLTVDENIQLDAYLTASMRSREFSWLQYESGLIDAAQWNTELAVIRSIMSAPRVRLWWTRLGRTYVSGEFAAFVDDLNRDPLASDDWAAITRWSDE